MDQHAQRIRDMFSSIAGKYDLLNRILSLGLDIRWRRRAARSFPLHENALILDVCAGTGDLAAAFLDRAPAAEAVALDFAEPMLRIAQRRRKQSLHRFHPVLGDALRLPFPDARFDVVGCAFGIRNLSSLDEGFREFRRVLRPGGVVCLLEFTAGDRGLLGPCVRWYVNRVIPLVGWAVSSRPSAYRYLARSVTEFVSGPKLVELLERGGFTNTRLHALSFGACNLITAERSLPGDQNSPHSNGSSNGKRL